MFFCCVNVFSCFYELFCFVELSEFSEVSKLTKLYVMRVRCALCMFALPTIPWLSRGNTQTAKRLAQGISAKLHALPNLTKICCNMSLNGLSRISYFNV